MASLADRFQVLGDSSLAAECQIIHSESWASRLRYWDCPCHIIITWPGWHSKASRKPASRSDVFYSDPQKTGAKLFSPVTYLKAITRNYSDHPAQGVLSKYWIRNGVRWRLLQPLYRYSRFRRKDLFQAVQENSEEAKRNMAPLVWKSISNLGASLISPLQSVHNDVIFLGLGAFSDSSIGVQRLGGFEAWGLKLDA